MLRTAQTTNVELIDLTKAFDIVCGGGMFAIQQRLGCPATLLSITSCFHNHMQASVRYNGSTPFFFKENVWYTVWIGRDLISVILGTRYSLILGTR